MDGLGPDALDSWLREWNCSFEGGHATNTITRVLVADLVDRDLSFGTPEPDGATSTVDWRIADARRRP